jgi:hypothetical protein
VETKRATPREENNKGGYVGFFLNINLNNRVVDLDPHGSALI